MTTIKHAPGYTPNPDYSQEDWDEVCDNPELTEDDFAQARPAADALPALAAALRDHRGVQAGGAMVPSSPRIDRDVRDA